VGADTPDAITPLLDTYLERFPRAARVLPGGTPEARARQAVVVRCVPRLVPAASAFTVEQAHPRRRSALAPDPGL